MMMAGAKFALQPSLPRERFREIKPGEPTVISDLTVTSFSVDHSIYGSQAFLIEAEERPFCIPETFECMVESRECISPLLRLLHRETLTSYDGRNPHRTL